MSDLTQVSSEVRHLSPSKIEGLMKCPEQFRLRYVEKIPEPSVGVMLAGRVVHAVIERSMKQVRFGKPLPVAHEMDDWFLVSWNDQIKEEEEKPSFLGWEWDEDDPPEKAKAEFRALIPYVRESVLPEIRPKFIEEPVKLMYPSEIGEFLVWGQLDLMDEAGAIWDWKTTAKVSANAKKGWFQFAHYSRLAVEVTGDLATPIKKTFLVRGKRPKHEIVPFVLGPMHREWFARVAANAWKVVKAGAYVANTGGWWCAPDWCGFYAVCQGDFADIEVHLEHERKARDRKEKARK